jgi:hypothetical protein
VKGTKDLLLYFHAFAWNTVPRLGRVFYDAGNKFPATGRKDLTPNLE